MHNPKIWTLLILGASLTLFACRPDLPDPQPAWLDQLVQEVEQDDQYPPLTQITACYHKGEWIYQLVNPLSSRLPGPLYHSDGERVEPDFDEMAYFEKCGAGQEVVWKKN
jgi:hypothetical protein